MKEEIELPINFQFKCKAKPYLVVVRQFLYGQWRIQLCKGNEETIIRQACTYIKAKAVRIKDSIIAAQEPEAYMQSLARPWNCESSNGRIRLDNTASSVIGPWPPWTDKDPK